MGLVQGATFIVFAKCSRGYRGSPTYTKVTNTVPTTMVLGLHTCKWVFFRVSRGPPTVPLT